MAAKSKTKNGARSSSAKKEGDAFKLDEDIKNISGATLSCKNISNGVKRIVATYQAAMK